MSFAWAAIQVAVGVKQQAYASYGSILFNPARRSYELDVRFPDALAVYYTNFAIAGQSNVSIRIEACTPMHSPSFPLCEFDIDPRMIVTTESLHKVRANVHGGPYFNVKIVYSKAPAHTISAVICEIPERIGDMYGDTITRILSQTVYGEITNIAVPIPQ